MKDYYNILGINRDADEGEIKKAYRLNAVKYHPDKNFGDKSFEEKFKIVNEAYSVLIDENKKREYDILWDEYFSTRKEKKEEPQPSFTSSTTYKQDTPEEEQFHYNPHKPFYSSQDRFTQETPQYPPKKDHWGNKLPDDIDFFILPTKIGKIISGFSDLKKSDKSVTGGKAFLNILKGVGIGLAIGGAIVLIFSVKSPLWLTIWLGVPTIVLGWIMSAANKLRGYENIIGINGFAEYKCEGTRTNITKKVEVNFNNVTDLITVTQINKMNFSYSSTSYGFVWLNKGQTVLEVNNEHDSKQGNPDKDGYPEYWLHRTAEKYWTVYLLDNMETKLQNDGYLLFHIAHYENNRYKLTPYIRMGIGYIEFISNKGNVKYNYNEIKRIYTKGTNLYIEHDNYEKILFFIKSGNRNEIPLLNLTNRQFFFRALDILVGYKF